MQVRCHNLLVLTSTLLLAAAIAGAKDLLTTSTPAETSTETIWMIWPSPATAFSSVFAAYEGESGVTNIRNLLLINISQFYYGHIAILQEH